MEEQLQELSIFALRELARRTGVNSPTSKTKQQMINDIIAIKNGVKKPHIPKTKQGRPPKSFGYDFSNIFADKNHIAPAFSKSATLKQDSEEFKNISSCEVEGIVEVVSNNVGFVWVNNLQDYDCYFVPSAVVEKYAVSSGDKVKAVINFENEQTIVESFVSINDVPANKQVAKINYFDIEHLVTDEEFEFSKNEFANLKIVKGQNAYLYGKDNNQNTKLVINLLNSCKVENKIYINVSIAERINIF